MSIFNNTHILLYTCEFVCLMLCAQHNFIKISIGTILYFDRTTKYELFGKVRKKY